MNSENFQLAIDTIMQRPTRGIPSWGGNIMEHSFIEHLAGVSPGDYVKKPLETYLAMKKKMGTSAIDQWIPENPLTITAHGYDEQKEKGATTGAERIVRDDILIDSPEAALQHIETIVFPQIYKAIAEFDEDVHIQKIIKNEATVQALFGSDILKVPYGIAKFPKFLYGAYGYENYFMAYALYPEVMEKLFSLQADFAVLNNRAIAKAYHLGKFPPLTRLDHDMADSRGTLVDIKSLDKIWFPHFARCLEPLLKSGIKLIWHCDGNLMQMVPRLLEVGLKGFQGFQYEDGMDYEKICKMKANDGSSLIIIGGVSVTRTLPSGTPDDVKRELKWLVDNGPKTGLFLGTSSSVAPGVPWENIKVFIEGLNYYKKYGRRAASNY
ncbi:MAG: uroporphyrinogen decarboxylase family protein [Victivallales bacterium]|jgi:hypothetical protein